MKNVAIALLALTSMIFAVVSRNAKADAESARSSLRTASLSAENALALASTTYLEGDTYRRRSQQLELQVDSLSRALKERPVLTTTVEVGGHAGSISTDTVLVQPDSTVTLSFKDMWLEATVEYRPITMSADLDYLISPLRVKVGASCGIRDAVTGIRPAIISIDRLEPVPETGMEIVVDEAIVDPLVCNPPPLPVFHRKTTYMKGAFVGAVIAIVGLAF
jgi:hypothetical protein